MGRQGWNVKQAREMEGVISIDFDDFNSMFTIKAEVPVINLKYCVLPVCAPFLSVIVL